MKNELVIDLLDKKCFMQILRRRGIIIDCFVLAELNNRG
jgi:hypothetical protein